MAASASSFRRIVPIALIVGFAGVVVPSLDRGAVGSSELRRHDFAERSAGGSPRRSSPIAPTTARIRPGCRATDLQLREQDRLRLRRRKSERLARRGRCALTSTRRSAAIRGPRSNYQVFTRSGPARRRRLLGRTRSRLRLVGLEAAGACRQFRGDDVGAFAEREK
jgi:hypothetical protein